MAISALLSSSGGLFVLLAALTSAYLLLFRRRSRSSSSSSTTTTTSSSASGAPETVLPNGWKVRYFNKGELDFLFKEIVEDDTYDLIGRGLGRDDPVVFDVGANIGLFSVAVAHRYPKARILAFEPIPAIHAIALANLKAHHLGTTTTTTSSSSTGGVGPASSQCFRLGLSNERVKEVLFDFYPHFSLWTHTEAGAAMGSQRQERMQRDVPAIIRDQQATGQLPGWTKWLPSALWVCLGRAVVRHLGSGRQKVVCELGVLSDIVRAEGVDRIDLLKVDVEGCELQVLQGIEDEHWPLVGSVSLEVETFKDVEQVRALLESRGFRVVAQASEREKVEGVTSEVSHVWATRP